MPTTASSSTAATETPFLTVQDAHMHNLQHINVKLPLGKMTVITGPSGSGKSSLAFDTLFAEGQYRYLESLSSYARQFLDRVEKPAVESISPILPAVGLRQHNGVNNARSTVGSLTHAQHHLGVLAHIATPHQCSACGSHHIHATTAEALVQTACADSAKQGSKALLTLTLSIEDEATVRATLESLHTQGGVRLLSDAQGTLNVWNPQANAALPTVNHAVQVVLDRWVWKAGAEASLLERIGDALKLAKQWVHQEGLSMESCITLWQQATIADKQAPFTPQRLPLYGWQCWDCGTPYTPPTLDAFNPMTAQGACPTCEGFGRVVGVDPTRVIPNPKLTLAQGALHPFQTPSNYAVQALLEADAPRYALRLNVPYDELTPTEQQLVWHGFGRYEGITPFFEALEAKRYKVHVRVFLAKYRGYTVCPSCHGSRFKASIAQRVLWEHPLQAWVQTPIHTMLHWLPEADDPTVQAFPTGIIHTLKQLKATLTCLQKVGLGYLTLARPVRTLSNGEAQRVQLTALLASELTDTLYVLDEPTTGLHAKDTAKLIEVLHELRDLGNTVVLVEHDPDVMQASDWLIDIGPASGHLGGQVVFQGTLDTLQQQPIKLSKTAQYLAQPDDFYTLALQDLAPIASHPKVGNVLEKVKLPTQWPQRHALTIHGACGHNLKNLTVAFPLQALTCVVGVSGAGKTTLLQETLFAQWQAQQGTLPDDPPLPCQRIEGLNHFSEVLWVDQSPPARSKRSNPATYMKVYDDIRKLFASTPKAQALGIKASDFSFNSPGGRCETCEGLGVVTVDMQFLADMTLTCPDCNGQCFQEGVLSVEINGKNIHEVLSMSIAEVVQFFKTHAPIKRKLQPLLDLGLGYLPLGQNTSSLSGGEAQRLKLASYLPELGSLTKQPCLFLFDEPTIGLHMADVPVLIVALRRLVAAGHTVIVIEHHQPFVQHASDWVIELGPEAGDAGGTLTYAGANAPTL